MELEEPGGILPSAWQRRALRERCVLTTPPPAVAALCEAIETQTMELLAIEGRVSELARAVESAPASSLS